MLDTNHKCCEYRFKSEIDLNFVKTPTIAKLKVQKISKNEKVFKSMLILEKKGCIEYFRDSTLDELEKIKGSPNIKKQRTSNLVLQYITL